MFNDPFIINRKTVFNVLEEKWATRDMIIKSSWTCRVLNALTDPIITRPIIRCKCCSRLFTFNNIYGEWKSTSLFNSPPLPSCRFLIYLLQRYYNIHMWIVKLILKLSLYFAQNTRGKIIFTKEQRFKYTSGFINIQKCL